MAREKWAKPPYYLYKISLDYQEQHALEHRIGR